MRRHLILAPALFLQIAAAPGAKAPPQVMARVAGLDAQCRAAGGQPVAQPYIFVHDYTGDGRPDYLLSEGKYVCAGRPDLFRRDGKAVVEVYAARPDGSGVSIYRANLAGYRLLDRTPTLIQVVRSGSECGSAQACGFDLAWNPAAGRLEEKPLGGAGQAIASAAAPPPAAEPTIAGAPTPMTQAQVLADCRARQKRQGTAARSIASVCAAELQLITAALPMARTIVKLEQAPRDEFRTIAGVRALTPTVKWTQGPKQNPPLTALYQADYGRDTTLVASGAGRIDRVSWAWSKQTATFPYDVPGALRFLGARVAPIACGTGGGAYGDERETVYRVEMPGAPPFLVSVGGRDAGSGGEWGNWAVEVRPGEPALDTARFIAKARADPDNEGTTWSASCPA